MNIVCHLPKRLHLGVFCFMVYKYEIFFEGVKFLHCIGIPYFWLQFLYFRFYGLMKGV